VAIKIVANDFHIPDQSLKFQQQLDKFYVFKINPAALRLGLYGKHDGIELSLEISYVRFFPCLMFVFFGHLFVKQCRVEETVMFIPGGNMTCRSYSKNLDRYEPFFHELSTMDIPYGAP